MNIGKVSTTYRIAFEGEEQYNLIHAVHYSMDNIEDIISDKTEAYDIEYDGHVGSVLTFTIDNDDDTIEETMRIKNIINSYIDKDVATHKTFLDVITEISTLKAELSNENNQEMRNDIESAIFDAKLPLVCPFCGEKDEVIKHSDKYDYAGNCSGCDTHFNVNTKYMYE